MDAGEIFFELGEAGCQDDEDEVVSAKVGDALAVVLVREVLEVGAEDFDGVAGDVGTEIFVELVYLLDVDKGNGIVDCGAVSDLAIKEIEQVVAICHAELDVVVVKVGILVAQALDCDEVRNA